MDPSDPPIINHGKFDIRRQKDCACLFFKVQKCKSGPERPPCPLAGTGTKLEGLCLTVRRSDCKDTDFRDRDGLARSSFFKVSRGRRSEHEVARPPNEVYYLIKYSEEGVGPAGNVVKLNVDSG